jgi:molybdate transport system ATP-binding protein
MILACDIRLTRGAFTLDASAALTERVTGLFGPSGSGKSTLLHLIAGLLRPDSGRLLLDDEALYDASTRINIAPNRRRIGLVFQDSQLFPHLTVKQNLSYGLNLLPRERQRFTLPQIVDLLELGALLLHRPNQLSGGQRQRVALGRALLASPRLLLLDEPLASLDERLKQQILPFLRRVKDEVQIPMIYVSHAINEILYLTQNLVVLDQGRVIGQGIFPDVITDPAILTLVQSLGLENVLAVEVLSNNREMGFTLGRCNGHTLYLPVCGASPGETIFVMARAANVALASEPVAHITIQNQLPGTIRRLTQIANRMLIEVDVGTPILAEVSLKAASDLHLHPGDPIYCLIKAQTFTHLGTTV